MNENKVHEFKIILTITISVIGIILIAQSFPRSRTPIYEYQISQDTDYKVYLIENEFIDKQYLEKNQAYIQNLVKYIDLNFLYYYQSSEKNDLDCKYSIIATLLINYSNTNQQLIEKQYPIILNKTLNKSDINVAQIKETINIDYQQYYNEVQKFKQQFNLPIKASLKVNFTVESIAKYQELSNLSASEVTIDLTEPVFEIKVQDSENQVETVLDNKDLHINYTLLVIGLVIFIISTIYLIYFVRKVQFLTTTKLKIKIREILRKYSEIIVELEQEPNIKFEKIIEVKDFNELLDIEEEIREPILYYEKDEEYVFSIINKDILYRKRIKEM